MARSTKSSRWTLFVGGAVALVLSAVWISNFWALHTIHHHTTKTISDHHQHPDGNPTMLHPGGQPQQPKTQRRQPTTTKNRPPKAASKSFVETKDRRDTDNNNNDNYDDDDDGYYFHVVFSSGCNALQDWQSYAFFHSIMDSGFAGNVTRVASCETPQQADVLRQSHLEQITPMSEAFRLHTTPDYSHLVNPKYNFFNKPFGIRHWMEHSLKLPQNIQQHAQMIVVIMDPDQFLIRPFRRDMTNEPELWMDAAGYRVLKPGQPMGAQYGFGGGWIHKINVAELLALNTTEQADTSGMLHWNSGWVGKHLSIGPPYVAVVQDMYAIVKQWSNFVVAIHNQYVRLKESPFMAEMYAYSTAAAHLNLPHQAAKSFMISDPVSAGGEAWKEWIDSVYDASQKNLTLASQTVCSHNLFPRPHVYHFCQRMFLGPYFFSKYQVPKGKTKSEGNFLSCEHALFQEPPDTLAALYDWGGTLDGHFHSMKSTSQRLRMTFALCHVLPRINAAATYYKQHHCTTTTANYNKTFLFPTTKQQNSQK